MTEHDMPSLPKSDTELSPEQVPFGFFEALRQVGRTLGEFAESADDEGQTADEGGR